MEENTREITAYINSQPFIEISSKTYPTIKLKTRSQALRKAGVLSVIFFGCKFIKVYFGK
jgi:hypothetical protein